MIKDHEFKQRLEGTSDVLHSQRATVFSQIAVVISLFMVIFLTAWSSVIILDDTTDAKTVSVDHSWEFLHGHAPLLQKLTLEENSVMFLSDDTYCVC